MSMGSPYFLAEAVAWSKVVPRAQEAFTQIPQHRGKIAHTTIVSVDPESLVSVLLGVIDDRIPFS